jgi:hypothetical protein
VIEFVLTKMKKSTWVPLFFMVFSVLPAFSQIDTNDVKYQESGRLTRSLALFNSDELLNVSIRFDLTAYLKKNLKENSLPGVMTFHLSDKDSINRKISIKTRGIFRLENCKFAPMQINFKKVMYAYEDSGKVGKVKLVTHCDMGSLNDEYVLREYLVYKLFNVLSDTSFRVRLLRVQYIDTEKKRKTIVQYGFFIEPAGILASRTNSTIVKATNLNQIHILPDVMDRVAIFNYMIGNYDWSVPGRHNIAVVLPRNNNTSSLGVAVPFDFDLTGVVNADYAIPSEESGVKTIRDRKFLGICRDKEVYKKDLFYFQNRKEELYGVVKDFPYLNQRSKKDITTFLDEFFDQLGRKNSLDNLISTFIYNCKK